MNKANAWFRGLSKMGKVTTVSVAAIVFFSSLGSAAQPPSNKTTPGSVQGIETIQSVPKPKTPVVEVKAVVTTEQIPFTSSTVTDSTLDQGTTQTRTIGVDGLLTHTYQVTYTDGIETSRSAPVDTITTPAVNEVIAKGTKVPAPTCLNGTYINSIGNTVCSPYVSNSAPAGATAQCSDGTYSFSQSRSGTCSHHGGVAVWL